MFCVFDCFLVSCLCRIIVLGCCVRVVIGCPSSLYQLVIVFFLAIGVGWCVGFYQLVIVCAGRHGILSCHCFSLWVYWGRLMCWCNGYDVLAWACVVSWGN